MSDYIWYAAYGSNMQELDRYLDISEAEIEAIESVSFETSGELFFAGEHTTWGGGVAFATPYHFENDIIGNEQQGNKPPKHEATQNLIYCKAYRLTLLQLEAVIRGENWKRTDARYSAFHLDGKIIDDIKVGEVYQFAQITHYYDSLWRLPDIGDYPCVTLTTSWDTLTLRPPTDEYAQTIRDGLTLAFPEKSFDDYFKKSYPQF